MYRCIKDGGGKLSDSKIDYSRAEIDYEKYSSGVLSIIVFSVLFFCAICIYFYVILRNILICFCIASVMYPYAVMSFCKHMRNRKINRLEIQFSEALQFISSVISSGGTIESSFYEYARSSSNKSNDDSLIKREFNMIARRMDVHESAVYAFSKFAQRSGSSDIKVFSLALTEMSSSGGNLSALIRNTAISLRIKHETSAEIDLILAAPKYNHRIVSVMPFAIVILMNLVSPDYMLSIYSGYGQLVAAVSSVFIIAAWILGTNISDIKI